MAVSMATGLLLSSSTLTLRTPRFAFHTSSSSSSSSSSSTLRMAPLRIVTSATVSQPPPTGGKIRGIMKPKKISPEMQDLVGQPEISRTQALKSIWAHIKEHNLQNPEKKRLIRCDEKLKKVFAGRDEVDMLEIAGLISPHFLN
ncbi:putative transcription regulator SWI/SNF-BAF60b family [Medicago truncatula]|uniref:Putative transcription regulator SWI/SNF-BAF60b family n=1 Tax=Medicago truncatula TaxID=3880 RepID=G7K0Y0_MEDTR|nr:upstream activation factor subunit UAF30 [Medicago truncatula]AES93588.1 SWIB/MDM2 domain protein [Medicago truncatula]AFK49175.1 unknown [Medicago truncatula]RHN53229.1 putative transcription regulator SWI/SNF-BAF60b family [Medicago truncatula]